MRRANVVGRWPALLVAVVISGCGGGAGPGAKDSSSVSAVSLAEPRATIDGRARAYSAADSVTAEGPISDRMHWPEVVHLEQVQAIRVDRTRFDYTFAIHVRGSGVDIRDGQFTLTAVGDGSTVRDGAATFSSLNAGRYQVLSDTITIRHDRTRPFDATKIAFDFLGTIAAQATTGSTAPRIANVSFSAFGGRPGHEGYFKIDSSEPPAGQQLELTSVIRGAGTSASYQLLSPGGTLISGAPEFDTNAHK